MLIVFFRAVILYALIIFAVRLMGKRQIGELQPSELVVTILMSNIATLPIEDVSIPMIMGVVPIFTFVCLDVFMSQLAMKSRRLRKLFSGEPKIIISEGKIDQKVMHDLRYTVDDLMESLRGCDVFDISQVQLAVVETTGKITVCRKSTQDTPSRSDMKLKTQDADPPALIVADGDISEAALRLIGRDRRWVEKIAAAAGAEPEDIFILTADKQGVYTLIRKEGFK
ncbi:MAG: DUF421 domain-containing protein [Ruminococcus sp.]|nr:DUF421 domain-containing protein [Ruminococcus sp.]